MLVQFYQSAEDVPDPRELSSDKKNLTVFDDLLLQKENTCESYYVIATLLYNVAEQPAHCTAINTATLIVSM